MNRLFDQIESLDIVVHSLAYANTEALEKPLSELRESDFLEAVKISSFSFLDISKRSMPKMKNGGSILTMTYMGSERVMTGYGVMGPIKAGLEAMVKYLASECGEKNIRVNAISAGPMKTLASSVFPHFNAVLDLAQSKTPLRRNIEQNDVGELASFLASDSSKAITGGIHFVDAGAHIVGA